jgi:hypothetical protein
MGDRDTVLASIKRLPENASFGQMRERIDFLAALRAAELSLERGEGIPHEEVKRQFSTWTRQLGSKSSGRRRASKMEL